MRSYSTMVFAAFFLGMIGVSVKLVGDLINPMTLIFYRLFFAFIFLVVTVPLLDRNTFKVNKKDLRDYFLVSIAMVLSFSTYVLANVMTSVHNVVLLNYIHPFIVLIIAYFALGEKINRTKMITLIMAVIGLAIINPFSVGANVAGNVMALVSALFYSFLVVLMRKEDRNHSIGDVFWFFLFATIMVSPLPFIYGFGNILPVLPYLIILGSVSTGVGYLFFNISLEKLEAEVGSIICMLGEPLTAIILSTMLIGETATFNTMFGGAILISAGIYLEMQRKNIK